jgi:pheromone shutdown protein TraB
LTIPEKGTKRRRRRKHDANAEWKAVIVGILLGGAFGGLQLLEAMPRWSEVPDFLSVITPAVAVLLVTAAVTDRVKTGLLCGAIAATSQLLAVLGFYAYSFTIGVALAVVPLQSLRILMYPATGIIGGYFGDRTTETRSVEPSRVIRHRNR